MRSKRQRKQKDKDSLRGKQLSSQQNGFDSNAVILPEPKKQNLGAEEAAVSIQKPLSKSQQRKLRRLQEEKERRDARSQVYETLAANQISHDALSLLRPAAALGKKETKKEALRRALKLERAGIELPASLADIDLLKERKESRADSELGSEEEDSSSFIETDAEEEEKRSKRSRHEGWPPGDEGFAARIDQKAKLISTTMNSKDLKHVIADIKNELDVHAQSEEDEEPQAVVPKHSSHSCPTTRVVHINRRPDISEARENLPIVAMEQEIMEAVQYSDVVVLCGETGCGKTTQVPQFLLEAGYGCDEFPERSGAIAVTQPRRVAAVATARRIADEVNSPLGTRVGYAVRHDVRCGSETVIKCMTDGVLLRELREDFLLRKYSVVVVDEAHERSLNTDIVLGILSRVLNLRASMTEQGLYPLKLIIMSATLRTEDFMGNRRLFSTPPPLVHVPARQYPVTIHFSKRTELDDYVGAAARKVKQIHTSLPPGGILVFLTGQREVDHLVKRLRTSLSTRGQQDVDAEGSLEEAPVEMMLDDDGSADAAELSYAALGERIEEEIEHDDYEMEDEEDEEEDVVVLGGEGFTPEQIAQAENDFEQRLGVDLNALKDKRGGTSGAQQKVHVLPLYAALQPSAQARVFKPPPEGHRLIIVATNVAETSLTIPSIRYVVDAGRSKQKLLESGSAGGGMARFDIRWVSKASAEQRAGRAGRTGPGHCYRLFSSAVYNDYFPQHTPPEIVNSALESVALSLKSLGIDKVANFPFPTPPEESALQAAERCLVSLSALDNRTGALTTIGAEMASYPIGPRHARMLVEASSSSNTASKRGLFSYAIALAAALSVESPFLSYNPNATTIGEEDDQEAKEFEKAHRRHAREAHAEFRVLDSEALSVLRALCAFESGDRSEQWCKHRHLHFRNLKEASALRHQLARLLIQEGKFKGQVEASLPPPTPAIMGGLRIAVAAGWADRIAKRIRSVDHIKATGGGKTSRAVRYRSALLMEDIYLHPHSTIKSMAPEYLVYTEIIRSIKRPYMIGVSAIEPMWLPDVASPLCRMGPPLNDPPPVYSKSRDVVLCWRDVFFGKHDWELPQHATVHPNSSERAAYFAAALLEGTVFETFKALRKTLTLPPKACTQLDLRAHKKVSDLLEALEKANIDTKQALVNKWREEGNYLKKELIGWMQKGTESVLLQVWNRLTCKE